MGCPRQKDADEWLKHQTIRTGLNRGHCGHSKSLVGVADTVQKEQSHHFTRKAKHVFSALGMEIAQPHPGLESRAEPPGGSAMKLLHLQGYLRISAEWLAMFSLFFFVKPPHWKIDSNTHGTKRMVLEKCQNKGDKVKRTQPNCACAGVSIPAEHRHPWAVAAAEHLQTTLPVHQNEPRSCGIRSTQLCSALENSWLGLSEYVLRNQTVT